MYFNGQIVKQTLVYPCNTGVLSDKKEWTTDAFNSLKETQGTTCSKKKVNLQKLTFYDSAYLTFSKRKKQKNYIDG